MWRPFLHECLLHSITSQRVKTSQLSMHFSEKVLRNECLEHDEMASQLFNCLHDAGQALSKWMGLLNPLALLSTSSSCTWVKCSS